MLGSLGASSSIFQASSSRSLRRSHWMRLKRRPTSALTALAGSASSSLPALPPRLHHGDARRDLLLLVGGKQLRDPQRRRGRRLVVRIEQPVDARAVMSRR